MYLKVVLSTFLPIKLISVQGCSSETQAPQRIRASSSLVTTGSRAALSCPLHQNIYGNGVGMSSLALANISSLPLLFEKESPLTTTLRSDPLSSILQKDHMCALRAMSAKPLGRAISEQLQKLVINTHVSFSDACTTRGHTPKERPITIPLTIHQIISGVLRTNHNKLPSL